MFRRSLDELYSTQRQRIGIIVSDTKKIQDAFESLKELGLDVNSIDEKCCAELRTILQKRYDDPIANGKRLQGYGWTHKHVEDHMNRYLRQLLLQVNEHLRTHLSIELIDK